MIVKIMNPAGSDFEGVNYNDKKIDKGKGELMLMKNFPSFINENSDKQQVRDYLKAISSGNKKVLKPQFHATISTKFREHSESNHLFWFSITTLRIITFISLQLELISKRERK